MAFPLREPMSGLCFSTVLLFGSSFALFASSVCGRSQLDDEPDASNGASRLVKLGSLGSSADPRQA